METTLDSEVETKYEILQGKKVLYLPEFDLEHDMVGRWRHEWPSKYLSDYGMDWEVKGAMEPAVYRPTNRELEEEPNRSPVEINPNLNFNNTSNTAQEYLLKKLKKDIDGADIVVFGRTNDQFLDEVFDYAKCSGKVVGYEVDDLTFGPDGAYVQVNMAGEKSLSSYIDDQIKKADFVTVTTPYLAKEAAELRGSTEDVYIVKNRFDVEGLTKYMPEVDHTQKEVTRIGWAGGKYHIDKILKQKEMFRTLHDIHGSNIKFVFKGIHEDSMTSDSDRSQLKELRDFFGQENIDYELHPYTRAGDWKQYYKDLAALDIDIFFAPLTDDRGHESKSELKYLESSFIGAPIVVPAIGGHKYAINQGENGILVDRNNNIEQFTQAIDLLVRSPELRQKLASNARENLIAEYDLRKSSTELANIFSEQLVKARNKPNTLRTLIHNEDFDDITEKVLDSVRRNHSTYDGEELSPILKHLRKHYTKRTTRSLGKLELSDVVRLHNTTLELNESILSLMGDEYLQGTESPLVSLITPARHGLEKLKNIIGDLRAQDYQNFEMLIGSQGMNEDIREFIDDLEDDRIKYIPLPESESESDLRNKLIKLTEGKYTAFVNDDAQVNKHYLNRLVSVAEKEDADIAVGKIWHILGGFLPYKNGFQCGEIDCMNALIKSSLVKPTPWKKGIIPDFQFLNQVAKSSRKTIFLDDIVGNHDPAR